MSEQPTGPQYPTDPAAGRPPQAPYAPTAPPQPYVQPAYAQPSYPQAPYAQPVYVQPAYGQPMYAPAGGVTPYGVDPVTGLPWSDKSKTTAGLLSLLLPFVGVCGVGRLYAGNLAIGLTQLIGFVVALILIVAIIGAFIAPAIWLWAVIDGIILLASGGKDGHGRPLR